MVFVLRACGPQSFRGGGSRLPVAVDRPIVLPRASLLVVTSNGLIALVAVVAIIAREVLGGNSLVVQVQWCYRRELVTRYCGLCAQARSEGLLSLYDHATSGSALSNTAKCSKALSALGPRRLWWPSVSNSLAADSGCWAVACCVVSAEVRSRDGMVRRAASKSRTLNGGSRLSV